MELTKVNKTHIDSLSHFDLLKTWRFSPAGNVWLQGETGKYWGERMVKKRDENPGRAVADSKALGFKC